MRFRDSAGPEALRALEGVQRSVYWLDRKERPDAGEELVGSTSADLLVVGGGFTGLWTALLAKRAEPGRDVVLVEGRRIADGATGRNGGFVSASLTHGVSNGLARWPNDLPTILRMGMDNLDAIEATIDELGIDCGFSRSGELTVAVAEHQLAGLAEAATESAALGEEVSLLDGPATRALVASPAFLGGLLDVRGCALVDPARLAWGLRAACIDIGVRVFERTPIRSCDWHRAEVTAIGRRGVIHADRVALATNAYPPLIRRLSNYVVPVYDYVLMTEPLSADQWADIGWTGRQGVSDAGNQFHYFRPTLDGRILWGGYDAVYHRGSGFAREHEDSTEAYQRLAEHFLQTFPQLVGIRFSHAWGGAIDTCSRFSAFWGTAHRGRTAYVAGYTGLGVGASRFGALTMLDLLDGLQTERTQLEMVRSKPIPFPPEPLRSWGIRMTTSALQAADAGDGRRNLWLKTLDRVGMGFDS